ncbi:MAG TPA: hypothetical protein VNN80_06520, partial [Polyangiaceae bacterium]|nr:hypothetical protein [Polyangiaceae bacterium]
DREIYCRVVLFACSEFPAYENLDQCLETSATFERGVPGDFTDNTLRCRRYHALNALADPNTHCSHAGPAGDGHCATVEDTGNCTSYCRILSTACGDAFTTEFNQDIASCVQSCSSLPDAPRDAFGPEPRAPDAPPGTPLGPPRYTVGPNSPLPPGTLKCRTLHAVRALAAPNGPECASALAEPGSECAPDTAEPP